jgi:hypothetical protein
MCYHVIKTEKKEQIDKKASNKKDGFFTEGHGPVVYLSPRSCCISEPPDPNPLLSQKQKRRPEYRLSIVVLTLTLTSPQAIMAYGNV